MGLIDQEETVEHFGCKNRNTSKLSKQGRLKEAIDLSTSLLRDFPNVYRNSSMFMLSEGALLFVRSHMKAWDSCTEATRIDNTNTVAQICKERLPSI